MVWGCFSSFGLGPLVRVNSKQTANDYINVLNSHLLPYLGQLDNQNNYMYFKTTMLKFIEQGQLCIGFQKIILINFAGLCKAQT